MIQASAIQRLIETYLQQLLLQVLLPPGCSRQRSQGEEEVEGAVAAVELAGVEIEEREGEEEELYTDMRVKKARYN